MLEKLCIVTLSGSDCAVYSTVRRGPFDTPLVFRGTEEECIDFCVDGREIIDTIEEDTIKR